MWSTLNFGKHSGKSLPQVLFADPDWFFWAVEKGVFGDRALLKKESELLRRRARNIKIPASRHPDPVVEYFRRGSAASALSVADFDEARFLSARHLHVTGITPALSASCSQVSSGTDRRTQL